MKLICPSCGSVASAETWSNDADARQCLRLVAEMPESVSRRAIAYLALFRPMTGKGLRWSTALKLLAELDRMVKDPFISWEGRPARKNDVRAWAQAMDRMVEHPPKKLPLKSNGYLRATAYDFADEIDRQAEVRRNAAEATGARRSSPENFTQLDPDEMRRIRERKGV